MLAYNPIRAVVCEMQAHGHRAWKMKNDRESKTMKRLLLSSLAVCALAIPAQAADCPAITVADMKGVAAGAFPQQFEKAEFEAAAGCTMSFSENPAVADFNSRIQGNPALPPLAERIPAEPLVVVPYDSIGIYGGTFDAL
ncbi:MAG TPA: hypothetical protein VLA52_13285, partial [Thermohalobaculum sp.]|nr:hypothetical protein [Thermohalobaculum sp.]